MFGSDSATDGGAKCSVGEDLECLAEEMHVATPQINSRSLRRDLSHIKEDKVEEAHAETRDRTGDLQIFSLTLSQLSYRGYASSVTHS